MMTDAKTAAKAGVALPLIRVPAGAKVEVTMQSYGFIYLMTHWLGRQLLCSGPECIACESMPQRIKCYAVCNVGDEHSTAFGLLEATPGAIERASTLVTLMQSTEIEAPRFQLTKRKKNSRIEMECIGSTSVVHKAFRDPKRAAAAVAVLHGVRPPSMDEALSEWTQAVRPQANLLLVQAMKP